MPMMRSMLDGNVLRGSPVCCHTVGEANSIDVHGPDWSLLTVRALRSAVECKPREKTLATPLLRLWRPRPEYVSAHRGSMWEKFTPGKPPRGFVESTDWRTGRWLSARDPRMPSMTVESTIRAAQNRGSGIAGGEVPLVGGGSRCHAARTC